MRKDFSEIEGKAKALSSPLAHRMAEITMVRDELSTCLRAVQLWAGRVSEDDDGDDAIIHDALFRDCVVQFMACFGEDQHRLNPADAFGRFEGVLEFFGWLRDVRDSYAAHRFGVLRQSVPMLVLDDNHQKLGVGHIASIYRGPSSADDKANLLFVFSLGLDYATKLSRELNRQVQLELEALSADEIERLDDARRPPMVSPEFIRMTRENYRKSKSRRRARQQYRRRPGGLDSPPQKS